MQINEVEIKDTDKVRIYKNPDGTGHLIRIDAIRRVESRGARFHEIAYGPQIAAPQWCVDLVTAKGPSAFSIEMDGGALWLAREDYRAEMDALVADEADTRASIMEALV